MLDHRLNAYRPDLADIALEGQVEAERFVAGTPAAVAVPVAALRPKPDLAVGIDTELLLGETVQVLENRAGWCWIKSHLDGYVGYLPADCLAERVIFPTHVVNVQRTFLYPEPELRKPHLAVLSIGSRIAVQAFVEGARGNRYAVLEDGRAIFEKHVSPLGEEADFVEIASRFLHTPYLWGGRSGLGIDCSALVQLSLQFAGKNAPRDTDMQASGLGRPVTREELRRGDLVFWKGHVAIMEDADAILHANGHTMTVARENFAAAVERIAWLYDEPTVYRRVL